MDVGVRGGRKNGWVCEDEEFSFFCQVLALIDLREKDEGGTKEGLEEVSREASFEELPELSLHEELQDLEPHGGKAV